jgi:protein involved in sex pheromone biosynthesis
VKHKILLVLMFVISLSACSPTPDPNGPDDIIRQDGEYAMVDQFTPSANRVYHGTYLPIHQALEVGSRLVDLSKEHFDVNEYYLQEGSIITLTRLGALVRRESATNPIGLNPPSGSLFPNGSGVDVADAVVVTDVMEVNFMQKRGNDYTLAGISIAIVLNPNQSVGESRVRITPERLYEYGSDMGRKLESYLRGLSGVGDVPIYITLYSLESVDAILPGGMIGEGLFLSRSGQFSRLNESWILIPSNASNELNPLVHSLFLQLKNKVQILLPEATGVFARARVINQRIDLMVIDVNANVKTYTELLALTQLILNEVTDFEEQKMDIKIHIKNLNSTLVLIEKKANDDAFTIIYLN